MFLKSWWCSTYNRPLKDTLLNTYTLEELAYEYFDHIERAKASVDAIEEEDDRIEDEKMQEDLDWAEAEEKREKKEAEEEARLKADEEWMNEQIQKHKEEHGEEDGFGEDLSLDL